MPGFWQIGILKKELESVRKHRKQYRNRRFSVPVPVVSLVSYFQLSWGHLLFGRPLQLAHHGHECQINNLIMLLTTL